MAGIPITQPFPIFNDSDGTALEDGFIFVGEAGLNPKSNPIALFSDSTLETPLVQPVRTLAGYPVGTSGTPISIYASPFNYSIIIENKNNVLVTSSLFFLEGGGTPIVDITFFGVAGDGVTNDTIPVQAFFDFLANNGGKGIISVPVRVDTILVLNNPQSFIVEWLGAGTVMTANTIATPLTFKDCSKITFIRDNIDGRSTQQGAVNIADGVYHAMAWIDCVDMYSYQSSVKNYNGVGIYAFSDGGSQPRRNYIIEGQADCQAIGESRTGYKIENAINCEIINCLARGMSSVGLSINNGSVSSAIRGGRVENCRRAVEFGSASAVSPGDGAPKGCSIVGTIITNCDQGILSNLGLRCYADFPLIDQRPTPGYTGTKYAYRGSGSQEDTLRIRVLRVDQTPAIEYNSTALNNRVEIDRIESVNANPTLITYSANSIGCFSLVHRVETAGGVENQILRNQIVEGGTDNSYEYLGGAARTAPQELVRYSSSTAISIDGSAGTGMQLIATLFTFAPDEFIKDGDQLEVSVAGSFLGNNAKDLRVVFGGVQVALVGTSFINDIGQFLISFQVSARDATAQFSKSRIGVTQTLMGTEEGNIYAESTNEDMTSSKVVALEGALVVAAAGQIITVDKIIARTIKANLP